MPEAIGLWDAVASFALVALVLALSLWRGLGLERDVLWASARAAGQLLLVGLLFTAIFESDLAMLWAWLWVIGMVAISARVVVRRAKSVPNLLPTSIAAMTATTAVVLLVMFGFQILEFGAVELVVIAGITIGNTMPSVVLGANRMVETLRENTGQFEALLALGFARDQATLHFEQTVIRSALIPQIERTKVVGLIALPGAMTGLLLAGVDPIDAVVLQLAVMFLVLGAVATSVVIVSRTIARRALTPDLRVAEWITTS
ncbi:MAG: iron export ABC transporter permease subunit FetB [Acidimicrobiia bacterium]|nr:iron export ABC transporter permease subunit FetB [Acidimicrobiia bacterium]